MVNAQEWLDENYPKEQRSKISELDISNKDLEGYLKLEGFVNLERLDCFDNRLTTLNLHNCLQLKNLNCWSNHLTELKVNHSTKLVELFCWNNQLTNLDLRNLNQLRQLAYATNRLSEITIPFRTEQLISLDVAANKFPPQDCSFFSKLSNLQYLDIRVNYFHGSLKSLKKLTKLWFIDISDTDLDSGLEYLPENIKNLYLLSVSNRKNAKVKILEQELRKYGEPEKEDNWRNYNFANLLPLWKKANPDKMKIVQQERQIEKLTAEKTEIQRQLIGNQTIINNLQCELNETNFQLSQTIEQLGNANSQLSAWQCSVFLPQPTLGQPDSWLAFRTQINSLDTLGITVFYLLARHFYQKYRKYKTRPVPLDEERQPLLNSSTEVERLKQKVKCLKLELIQAKSASQAEQTQSSSSQVQFEQFLESYIVEKQEQIEQTNNKLELLQEELKVLENLQTKQQAQIQQNYPFRQ